MEGQDMNEVGALLLEHEEGDPAPESWSAVWEQAAFTAVGDEGIPEIMPNGDPSSLTLWGDDA
jgi:hypothetical protein